MGDSGPPNFSNRDLRNRSFRGQPLNGVDFSGSDLRGCDFSQAQLVGANFAGVKIGPTTRQTTISILIAGIVGLVTANGVAQLVFAALGQTPAQSHWGAVVMLYSFLGLAGAGAASFIGLRGNSPIARTGLYVCGICAGALTAFFYAGSYSDNNGQVAIAGAITGGLLMALLSWQLKRAIRIPILVMGAVSAYGFAYLVGTLAIAFLHAQQYGWSLGVGAVSLLYGWVAVRSLAALRHEINQRIGTSFRGADLTNAHFDQATLNHTDFSKALGSPHSLPR
jgi:hypothetical protein